MKPSRAIGLGIAALSVAALMSCSAGTSLVSSWADPASADRTYQKVVVVGVTTKSSIRRMYEDMFVKDLSERGIQAIASYSFAGEGQLDKEQANAKLKEMGADAVIVTRLVDQQTVHTYYPPTYSTVAAPSAYYGGWYGYYSLGYTYESSPGYVAEDQVYRVETNLYDVSGDKLIWSGLTETTLSSGDAPQNEISPMIGALVYDMEKHKVLPKRK